MCLWLIAAWTALRALGAAEAPAPPTPLPPAEAAKQGKALAAELVSQRPAQNATNTGVMKIKARDRQPTTVAVPVEFQISVTPANWEAVYRTLRVRNDEHAGFLEVVHSDDLPNACRIANVSRATTDTNEFIRLTGNQTMVPFAGSDFWVADLALEFLHWPEQRLLKTEMRRGRSCRVLESINPEPAPGAYSRVVSWIDIESGGIVHAEAYDFKRRLLKEFDPKKIKKVEGQWQLSEMEIDNRQTGSRTEIQFDLPD